MPRVLAVLPARHASTRFPGKPLADDTGRPLIRHVVERVREAKSVDRVIVATDDERIRDAVEAFGAEAVMTGEHPNGTSRIAEAVDALDETFDVVLNVQGDEPEVPGATIDALVAGLAERPDADMATLASPLEPGEDPTNTNIVKLVADRRGFAMYFSRSLIPFDRDAERLGRRPGMPRQTDKSDPAAATAYPGWTLPGAGPFKHPGLYAYRREFLSTYAKLPPAPLEETEKLEQLRVLEHGFRIAVVLVDAPHPGIDTPEQYADFVERWRAAHR